MLKTWLDDNLPGIVERLVSAEIERVARGNGAPWHESGENLSLSEELDGCEEAEGAEHWRYEDTAEVPARPVLPLRKSSRDAGSISWPR
jgi:hypothetical protein